ncbi:MAG: hypothetical protein FWF79_02070 [Defluviitaleaceae bacterium]|nr:hypothetical protein [Defluviitaleaceae bacterium]
METIRKIATENKKLVFFLAALVLIGTMFLLAGRFMREPGEIIREVLGESEAESFTAPAANRESFTYEQALERRLEEFFQMVDGAGQVRVMVSPMGSPETTFAVDVNESRSYSTEQDSQGGSRETHQYQINKQTVMITDRQGTDRPLVLHEPEPRTEGIVIIAEGGDSPFVRDALTRAARAVLGLEAHMIQVLTMTPHSKGDLGRSPH